MTKEEFITSKCECFESMGSFKKGLENLLSECWDMALTSKIPNNIDEKKLDELAFNAEKETFKEHPELPFQTKWVEGFKAGIRMLLTRKDAVL